jgi:hypothetical protein
MATYPLLGSGTSSCPLSLLPQATMEPPRMARLWLSPAEIFVNPLLGRGTLHWPTSHIPQATMLPSERRPRVW